MVTRDLRRTTENDIERSGTGAYRTVTGQEYALQRLGLLIDEVAGSIAGSPLTQHDAAEIASRVESEVDDLAMTTGVTNVSYSLTDESISITVSTSELSIERDVTV